jgi:thiamine transport system permease protein
VLIPIAHSLIALPFVVRAVSPVIRAIDPRQREAATMLGASPRRTWWEVDRPLVTRALLVGAGFAFAVSLGEFGATLFIARPDTPTIPVAIYRLLGQPGALNFGQAMAMSTILMVLTALSLLAVERFRGRGTLPF